MGNFLQWYPDGNKYIQNYGPFVAISAYIEQAAVYNTLNTNVAIYLAPNSTTSGIGLAALWCPSDGQIVGLRYPGKVNDGWDDSPIPMCYSSYAGNLGPVLYYPDLCGGSMANGVSLLNKMQGIFAYIGPPPATGCGSIPTFGLATVTDGTSNTMLYGEHAHSKITASNPDAFFGLNWWTSGDFGDTTYSTLFPPNYFGTLDPDNPKNPINTVPNKTPRSNNWAITATSQHPGGCNFAFCDGSVRFVKDSVNSWSPLQVQYAGKNAPYVTPQYGVYQALSTRNGGEIVSADAF
jgi:prepilin-type processing-associated H-X9-DG protein